MKTNHAFVLLFFKDASIYLSIFIVKHPTDRISTDYDVDDFKVLYRINHHWWTLFHKPNALHPYLRKFIQIKCILTGCTIDKREHHIIFTKYEAVLSTAISENNSGMLLIYIKKRE